MNHAWGTPGNSPSYAHYYHAHTKRNVHHGASESGKSGYLAKTDIAQP